MSFSNIEIPSSITCIPVDTRTNNLKVLLLPTVSTNAGRLLMFKDYYGTASNSTFTISTTGTDLIDDINWVYTFSNAWGSMSFLADGLRSWRTIGFYDGSLTPSAGFAFTAQNYLPLATNSGDLGASPQTVTTNGTVTYTTIAGKQCAYFNNSLSNYLSFTYTNPTNFTVSYWYYPFDTAYYTVVSITNAALSPALQNDTSSSTALLVVAALPNQWTVNQTATVPALGNWKFVTITINQTTFLMQVYINGTLTNSQTGSGTGFGSRDRFFIGRSGDNGRAYNGYVRQFTVYNRILTAAEVGTLYAETA